MSYRFLRTIKLYQALLDIILLNVALIAASGMVFRFDVAYFRPYLPVLIFTNLIWILLAYFIGMYDNFLVADSVKIFRRTLRLYILFVISSGLLSVVLKENSRLGGHFSHLFSYSLVLFGILLFAGRLVILSIRKRQRRYMNFGKNVVIVGQSNASDQLYQLFEREGYTGYKILGFFDDHYVSGSDKSGTMSSSAAYLGNLAACMDYIQSSPLDEVFCSLSAGSSDNLQQLMMVADRNMVRVRFLPDYYSLLRKPSRMEMIANIPVLSVRQEPLEYISNSFIKRTFDIVFSLLVIVFVLSWLLPILAIIIKLDSKGPVFFRQLRSGRSNEPFYCMKLRSMTVNTQSDSLQATKNDARITRVGAFLRRTSLDELPQFFNVLRGHMSVVGPRPHMLKHTEMYAELIDKFMVRHFLKPGITGWAQVTGLRGETKTREEMEERVEADVYYLEKWSMIFDFKIIFLTVWNAVKGDEKAF